MGCSVLPVGSRVLRYSINDFFFILLFLFLFLYYIFKRQYLLYCEFAVEDALCTFFFFTSVGVYCI